MKKIFSMLSLVVFLAMGPGLAQASTGGAGGDRAADFSPKADLSSAAMVGTGFVATFFVAAVVVATDDSTGTSGT